MRSARTLFTSESVTEGHPDKLCDQISDAVLDEILRHDPKAHVACETSTTTGLILVFGEITTETYIDIPKIVRRVVKDVGYVSADYGFDYATCGVVTAINEQSPEINFGVRKDDSDDIESVGAGDQGMMIGFACNETPDLMPLPISMAHAMARRMAELRKSGEIDYLRPDGKSQVTVEYQHGKPARVPTIVLSTQHDREVTQKRIREDLEEAVVRHCVPSEMLESDLKLYVNPSGSFALGGPMSDAGLTGRKIIVDTYGGIARHGGGAFSGKDPTKVDRSGAYAARYVAKNVVAAGLADRFEVQVSYAIGVVEPVSVHIEAFGTATVDEELIERLIVQHFDLRPGAILRDLDLRRPIYQQVAAYGHFGRPDLDLPWERIDKADALRQDAGL
ncbi:MAG: methionine adenosyltransferase [Thermomicrobiaceae bacterium]